MVKKIKILVIAGVVILALIFIKDIFNQKFDSVESLQEYTRELFALIGA